jgi:amidase
MIDPTDFDAVALAEQIRRGERQPSGVVDDAIARIEALNPALNAVISERFEAARAEAAGNLPDGPFRGVPILLKDLGGAMAGEPQHQGSRVLKRHDVRATEDSYLVARLRRAGFVVLGRTNTPEIGSAPVTEPLAYGPTRNPWNTDHTPGGSSGGSAAAVASGMVPLAHASDGGGSIRIPASCCGLFGLKPSRGRISRGPQEGEGWGGASTDGCVSRTVRDTAAYLDVVAGPEPGDPYTAPPPSQSFSEAVGVDPGRLRVGVLDHRPDGKPVDPWCAAAVAELADVLTDLGHQVETAAPAALSEDEVGRHYMSLIAVASARATEEWTKLEGRELGADDVELVNLIYRSMGAKVSGSQYLADLRWLHSWSRRVARFWTPVADGGDGFDVLLTPTLSRPPLRIGELTPDPADPGAAMMATGEWVAFTPAFNITGQPAMSIPVSWTPENLPVGAQLVGPAFGEELLLGLASQLESTLQWTERRPPHSAWNIDPGAQSPPSSR